MFEKYIFDVLNFDEIVCGVFDVWWLLFNCCLFSFLYSFATCIHSIFSIHSELVRDLFAAYKTRIWLKKYNVRHFYPKQYAIMALATGVQFNPDN